MFSYFTKTLDWKQCEGLLDFHNITSCVGLYKISTVEVVWSAQVHI